MPKDNFKNLKVQFGY